MMVELVANPENFEDVYPESDDAEDSEDDQSESDSESNATKALADEKKRNDNLSWKLMKRRRPLRAA